MHYWINTISRDHVQIGVTRGFTQANHGKATTLRQLAQGDFIVFYSPRTSYPAGEPLQRFTALGRVLDAQPYQAEMTPTFHPWRRRVEFLPCTEASIQPLIASLAFITDKRKWGFPFRRGLFRIGQEDFAQITQAMQVASAQLLHVV